MAIIYIDGVPMKRCPKCEQILPVANFGVGRTRSDGLAGSCKTCLREYRLAHYRSDPQPYKARARARVKELKEFMRELKEHPCIDCGIEYPFYVMQWDHIADNKEYTPSAMAGTNRERILAEVAKCELVCANCHAERTHRRRSAKFEVTR